LVVVQASKDCTVTTVQKTVKGYMHEFINHTRKEYTHGDVHENRAECLFSLLKPYLRVFRGLSK